MHLYLLNFIPLMIAQCCSLSRSLLISQTFMKVFIVFQKQKYTKRRCYNETINLTFIQIVFFMISEFEIIFTDSKKIENYTDGGINLATRFSIKQGFVKYTINLCSLVYGISKFFLLYCLSLTPSLYQHHPILLQSMISS